MAANPTQPPPKLTEGEVANAISGYFGVSAGDSAVTRLLALVFPDVERAAARDPASWKSVFPTVLAKYESLAKDLGLGVSAAQRELDAARNANPTGAGPVGAFTHLAARFRADAPLSIRDDSGSGRAIAAALGRDAPLTVSGAIGYARELGMNPALAGFFVGASHEMRDALRNAVRNGTSITDDQVKSPNDVAAVIGAIRSGKMKPDDPRVPPSVRQIMEEMKKDGIDPATTDPKAVKKYLRDHPASFEAAKQAAKRDVVALPTDQRQSANDAIEKAKGATASPSSAPKASGKLNLATPAG